MKYLAYLAAFIVSAFTTCVYPETYAELCQYSSRGQAECFIRLEAFRRKNNEDPLSDDELHEIFGCLKVEGLDTTGCDYLPVTETAITN